jgi:NitT/TauT family transport system ATP-binding protein
MRTATPSPASAQPLVSINAISKTFANGTQALSNVSLGLEHGEFLSLLGPSGCGKSTILRLLAGLDQPTTGAITWHQPIARDSIGYVFQEPTLMPWTSVWNNVYLPLRIKGVLAQQAHDLIADALNCVGLNGFEAALPGELSGGMRMRVSIARAMVMRPTLLLMDEPFAALDEITRLKLNHDLIALTRNSNTSVVFVTHSVYESVFLSSRIAIFSPRPGHIKDIINVPATLERTDEFRLSPDYLDHCQLTSQALHNAMNPKHGGGA